MCKTIGEGAMLAKVAGFEGRILEKGGFSWYTLPDSVYGGRRESMGGVHDGHRARMKKKLLESGEQSFADHELLEVLLLLE